MQTTAPQTPLERPPLASSRAAHPERWLHPLLLIVLCAVGAFLPAFILSAVIGGQ